MSAPLVIAADLSATCHCSFCGNSQHDVLCLIAGPAVFICDECIDLCNGIVRKHERESIAQRAAEVLEQKIAEQLAASSLNACVKSKRWFGWFA